MLRRSVVLRLHAAKRMLQRGIRVDDVEHTVEHGEEIETYADDTPFPSRLLLACPGGRALHVVAADEPGATVTYIITAYYPDPDQVGRRLPTEKIMKCAICKHGHTQPGETTISIERKGSVVVIRDVPASVCTTCGEEYLSAEVMRGLEKAVEQAAAAGLDVAVRHFKAA